MSLRPEARKSIRMLHLDMLGKVSPENGMPLVASCIEAPERFIGFNKAGSVRNKDCGIHFFIEDYQFERIWAYPYRYIGVLKGFRCVISPDFSIYTDMPNPVAAWQVYRARLLTQWWQTHGINVIYNVPIVKPSVRNLVFEGIVPHGIIALRSPISYRSNSMGRSLFFSTIDDIMERLHPVQLLYFGQDIKLPLDLPIVRIENENIKKLRSL